MRKRIFFTATLLLFLHIASFAQEWGEYTLFRTGYSHSPLSGNGLTLQGEYGKTYKWIDFGVSLTYFTVFPHTNYDYGGIVITGKDAHNGLEGNSIDENYGALSLHGALDCIAMFVSDTRHSLKIGGKLGLVRHMKIKKETDPDGEMYALRYQAHAKNYQAVDLAYEYAINNKLSLGVFYELSMRNSVGISICRNF